MLELAQQLHIAGYPPTTTVQEKSNEWYTPARYIEAARAVMGGIDLDPASCELANRTVKATRYYSKEDDGLNKEWYGRVWCNPPYLSNNNAPNDKRSNILRWVTKLLYHYTGGDIEQAILLVTTQTDKIWFKYLWDYSLCFADHHVRFYLPDGAKSKSRIGRMTDSHMFGTLFVYLGSNESRFIEVFSEFGTIAKRVSAPKPQPMNLELWTG